MAEIHRVIYDELCQGVVRDESRERYRSVVGSLVARGAEGVILGCTEITMLIGQDDVSVPTFDTTAIHADAAVRFAIADETGDTPGGGAAVPLSRPSSPCPRPTSP